jgi:pimeloyl-ACP methyl ester carboxylesterase
VIKLLKVLLLALLLPRLSIVLSVTVFAGVIQLPQPDVLSQARVYITLPANLTIDPMGRGTANDRTRVCTVTSSPAGLTCTGNVCTGPFPQGILVTLTPTPNGACTFEYWDDGNITFNRNPQTITMDANKTTTATFTGDNTISLTVVDSTPLGNRTPLILVHGNNEETDTQSKFGWNNFLRAFGKDSVFQSLYKVYLFSWDSEQSNAYNGMAMGSMVDRMPELQNRDVIILAHSRGGLIARYFMNLYTIKSGNHTGQLGGEKVKWLVTLATPHRGSPGADPVWVGISFDYNFPVIESALSDIYFTGVLSPTLRLYDPKSYQNLLWDDVDNELTAQAVCYDSAFNDEGEECTPLQSKTRLNNLSKFNQNERYFNKIIAYGGNNFSQSLYNRITSDIAALLFHLSTNTQNWNLASHSVLDLFTVLMEQMPIIPRGYASVPDNPERPFKANDGMVPLASALFLKHDASGLFQFNNNKFSYNKTLLNNFFCQVAECNVVNQTIDHLGFLDNSKLISTILAKLDNLH